MKALKWIGGIILVLGVGGYFAMQYMKSETKKHSPEDTITYSANNFKMSVTYSRPFKKDRDIFGGLVPYGEVWRTGANEPTIFTVNQQINFGDATVPAGTYTLWTIPFESQWTIILNSKMYDWGVGWDGKPARESEFDIAKINVPTDDLEEPLEQFTIDFEYHVNLTLAWDKTKVLVPIMYGYE